MAFATNPGAPTRRPGWIIFLLAACSIGATYVGGPSFYAQQNLVTDGYYEGAHIDSTLVNPWGLAVNPMGAWWVADEDEGKATIYDGNGVAAPLAVDIPTGNGDTGGEPTGIVFNPTSSFVVSDGTSSAPAVFLFAGIDGVISGWNPTLPQPAPSPQAHMALDMSSQGAAYFGLAIADTSNGPQLYAANFGGGTIDVFDGSFAPVRIGSAFHDPQVPPEYKPFNIMNLQGHLYLAYAKQDASGDEVKGAGLGFVSVFDVDGALEHSLIHHGKLNAPWGMAIAPPDFGQFSNALLVANFGDGRINAYDPDTGALLGTMRRASGSPIHVDGLWGIAFGNGAGSSPTNVLFFTAGPADEAHGVFGKIAAL